MSTSEKFVQPVIPRFDGHYDFGAMTMDNFLRSKEMWNLVEEGIPTPTIGTAATSEAQRKGVEEAKLKDLKVKNIFCFKPLTEKFWKRFLTRELQGQYGGPCSRSIKDPQS